MSTIPLPLSAGLIINVSSEAREFSASRCLFVKLFIRLLLFELRYERMSWTVLSKKLERPVERPSLTFSGYQCSFLTNQPRSYRSSFGCESIFLSMLTLVSLPFSSKKYSRSLSLLTNLKMSFANVSLLKLTARSQRTCSRENRRRT